MKAVTALSVLFAIGVLSLATVVWLYTLDGAGQQPQGRVGPALADSGGESPVYRRVMMKHHVACELAEAKLTLFEAAKRIKAMDLPEYFWEFLPLVERGNSTDERLCWHILDWAVGNFEEHEPVIAAKLRRRLESELQDYLDYHGTVVLR